MYSRKSSARKWDKTMGGSFCLYLRLTSELYALYSNKVFNQSFGDIKFFPEYKTNTTYCNQLGKFTKV